MTRVCYGCGTDKSLDYRGWQAWILNRGTDLALCKTCHAYIFEKDIRRRAQNKHSKKRQPRFMEFRGRRFDSHQTIRNGVCNLCRKVVPFDCKHTQIHHEWYDERNPLTGTLETCPSCHTTRSWEMEQLPRHRK